MWTSSASWPWLESSSRIPAGREAAEARRRAPCSQPVAQRRGELELGLALGVGGELVDCRQQQLLHRALERAQRRGFPRSRGRRRTRRSSRRRRRGCRRWPAPPGAGAPARSPRRCCRSPPARRAAPAARPARSYGGCRRSASGSGSRSGAPSCAGCWGSRRGLRRRRWFGFLALVKGFEQMLRCAIFRHPAAFSHRFSGFTPVIDRFRRNC